jgi:hypothetical protein
MNDRGSFRNLLTNKNTSIDKLETIKGKPRTQSQAKRQAMTDYSQKQSVKRRSTNAGMGEDDLFCGENGHVCILKKNPNT